MTLKSLINKHKNVIDFWGDLELHGGELLFEEYAAMYLKSGVLSGETYWLSKTKGDIVPNDIAEKFKFAQLLKGDRTLGMDIINIDGDIATAYESKWFHNKETINFKTVVNKQYPINKTKIDRLIFVTNAKQTSNAVKELVEEAAFLFEEDWCNQEVFDTVKNFVNTQQKKTYLPMKPRDAFFQSALDELKVDFDTKFSKKKVNQILTRIFQHWPAASGKGSFPRLAYDMIFEPRWNFKKSCPINVVVNPTLTVLKGNLVKHIQHDIALNNNVIHVIYAGDVTKACNNEEIHSVRALAKVFTDKKEYIQFINNTVNKTIWVHTTVHSYYRLAEMMKAMKQTFYFGHLDEVHHMIQPDHSSWTASLNDKECKIHIRLMSSANKRYAKGDGATYSMGDSSFSDIQVKDLDEKTAVALGYKRQSKIISYSYRETDFATDWLEKIDDGSQPHIKLKGTKFVVPLSWWMAADALLKFRIEHFQVNHTKLTLNKVENCNDFAKFFDAFRKKVLKSYCKNDTKDPMYKRLIKAKIMVADTHSNSTVKILKEVSAIPDTYKDSFVIHCRLLGEGWDPANGWIDSNMFVDATWSEIRIYQDVNRGSRIGDGSKKINYIIMVAFLNQESEFNKMFGNITKVGNALEMGVEDIKELVEFKAFKNMPKGQRMTRKAGADVLSYYDEMYADFLHSSLSGYITDGKYYELGRMVHEMVDMYQEEFEKRNLYNINGSVDEFQKRDFLKYEIILKYKEFFDQYANPRTHFEEKIITGKDFRLSSEKVVQIVNWENKIRKIGNKRRKDLLVLANKQKLDDIELTNYYKEKYSVKEVDPSFMCGNEKYFKLKYKFDDTEFVPWRFTLDINKIQNAVKGKYGII